MATEEEKKQELEDTIDSGVQSIEIDGQKIVYKDNDQLLQAKERLARKGRITKNIVYTPYYDKGL